VGKLCGISLMICELNEANFDGKSTNLIGIPTDLPSNPQFPNSPFNLPIAIKTKNPREDENRLTNSHAIPHLHKRDDTIYMQPNVSPLRVRLLSMKLQRSLKTSRLILLLSPLKHISCDNKRLIIRRWTRSRLNFRSRGKMRRKVRREKSDVLRFFETTPIYFFSSSFRVSWDSRLFF
jgi:hypothetical protein